MHMKAKNVETYFHFFQVLIRAVMLTTALQPYNGIADLVSLINCYLLFVFKMILSSIDKYFSLFQTPNKSRNIKDWFQRELIFNK